MSDADTLFRLRKERKALAAEQIRIEKRLFEIVQQIEAATKREEAKMPCSASYL